LRCELSVATLRDVEVAGLGGLSLNCPQCGLPMRYLHARTPEGQTLPADAPPTDSTVYIYACRLHGCFMLGVSTPFQREL
jgi:hypothetical protein